MSNSTLTFNGGAGSVTGANFLLDLDNQKMLIDCGMVQGGRFAEELNYEPFAYDPKSVGTLIVTHVHADHIGRIPKLVKDGFAGVIYSTPETRALAEIMFADALSIMQSSAREMGREPLYDEHDIERALSLWHTKKYHDTFAVGDVQVEFFDAGHILGSAIVKLTRGSRSIVFTGDLGNAPAPLLRAPEIPEGANYLLTESVYGDRAHNDRNNRVEQLASVLNDTYTHKKTLLIPSFAIDRTQVLLYEINKLVESGKVPEMPVFLDSPLAAKVTAIYAQSAELFNDTVRTEIKNGDNIFDFPKFVTIDDSRESAQIVKAPSPKVIIAGSGMSVGGRVIEHERALLKSRDTTILFIGYQAVGTLGRRIVDGAPKVNIGGTWVRVRAKVASISGFSGHADRDALMEFASHVAQKGNLEKVFVAMGEPKASLFLVQRLRDWLGLDAVAPDVHETVALDF